jgi:hypothetical protein
MVILLTIGHLPGWLAWRGFESGLRQAETGVAEVMDPFVCCGLDHKPPICFRIRANQNLSTRLLLSHSRPATVLPKSPNVGTLRRLWLLFFWSHR